MSTKICVFSGAGISAPVGLPTTNGFASTISKIEGALLQQINSFLKEADRNDIEQVLYLLEDFLKEKDFTNHIVKEGINNQASPFKIVYDNLQSYKDMAKRSVKMIKGEMYNTLNNFDAKKVDLLYSALIKELQDGFGDCSISFFTTNYDLTFENGFADNDNSLKALEIEDVFYGFGSAKNGKQRYNPSEDFEWNPKIIEYIKLHGSLDWNYDPNVGCVKTGTPMNPAEPEKMPMLYPGFKGTPNSQPFIDFHERLDKRLSKAELLIVVGFAFRDDYLNNIFNSCFKKNSALKVLCYNPCKIDNLPKDSCIKEFVEKYPLKFVHIEAKVEAKEKPLNIMERLKNLVKEELSNELFQK